MHYSDQVYKMAEAEMTSRRRKAEKEANERRNEFFLAFPRAREIENTLSKTAILTARAVLGGGNVREKLTELKNSNQALQKELSQILENAHCPSDHLEIRYTCPKCGDTGYIDGRMCSCLKQLLREKAYEELNAITPLSLSSFETFSLHYYPENVQQSMERIYLNCRRYAETFSMESPNLIMMGNTGLGKTHLSLAIAAVVTQKGYGVVYGSVNNLVSKLEKEHFGREEDNGTLESLLTCDLLILDDLGTEFRTAFSTAELYNIINTRQMAKRPTIISTNLTMKELESAYSSRFTSRIIADYVRCLFQGEDIRQKKRMMHKE